MTRIGSLFSGYGGLDMGLQAVLGGSTAWVSDIDKGACKILAHRYPDVPNLGDIATVNWKAVEPVDVLTGGFPCQDVSTAGKRAGLRPDTRSGLWSQMAYAIDQLRPRLVVAENVRGLLSAEAHSDLEPDPWDLGDRGGRPVLRALGAVLGDLARLGYDAVWHGLRAADVGAPHGRFRVFVVAYPAGDSCRFGDRDGGAAADSRGEHGEQWWKPASRETPSRGSLGEPSGRGRAPLTCPCYLHRHPPMPLRSAGPCICECDHHFGDPDALLPTPMTTDGGSNSPGDQRRKDPSLRTLPSLLPTPRAGDGEKGGPNQRGSSGDLMLPSAVQQLIPTPLSSDAGPRGGTTGFGLRDWSRSLLPTPRATHWAKTSDHAREKYGSSDSMQDVVDKAAWGQYFDAIARWEQYTRPAPAPTELSVKGTPRLSPRFSEWLMGLPDGWVTDVPGITRNEALKACGNGVVPQQAAAGITWCLDRMQATA